MGIGYIVCVAAICLVVLFCVRSIVNEHRTGSGCGGGSCSGNCGSCGGCGDDQDVIVTVKRKRSDKKEGQK